MKNLNSIVLKAGDHPTAEEGLCAMEAVAWLAGEPHSDEPECACPIITKFVIQLNDNWNEEERQLLKAYIPKIIGTNDGNEHKRAEILVKAVGTKVLPLVFEAVGLHEQAASIREAKDFTDIMSVPPWTISSANEACAYSVTTAYTAIYNAAVNITSYYASTSPISSISSGYPAVPAVRATTDAAYRAGYSAVSAARAASYAAMPELREAIIKETLNALNEALEVGK